MFPLVLLNKVLRIGRYEFVNLVTISDSIEGHSEKSLGETPVLLDVWTPEDDGLPVAFIVDNVIRDGW